VQRRLEAVGRLFEVQGAVMDGAGGVAVQEGGFDDFARDLQHRFARDGESSEGGFAGQGLPGDQANAGGVHE